MPYVIETHDAELLYGGRTTDVRIAVATLEEARTACHSVVRDDQTCTGMNRARATLSIERLPESGGTIGPLPDGTVIEVREVSYIELRKLAGIEPGTSYVPGEFWSTRSNILAAFNA